MPRILAQPRPGTLARMLWSRRPRVFLARGHGAARTRHSLRPSLLKWGRPKAKLGWIPARKRNRLLWSPAGEVRTLADAPAPRQGESDFCRKYSYLKGNSYLKGRRL